jgi:3-keto-L-gulonate-6-phosphate decarboxylase
VEAKIWTRTGREFYELKAAKRPCQPPASGLSTKRNDMAKLKIQPPVVQVAIDALTIDDALRIAEAAVKAGADWLEAGTPLITFRATKAIGALAREFPGVPVLADYKMMDGVKKYIMETRNQGGQLATICGVASDASIRTAIAAGQETEIVIISDLYAHPDVPGRAAQLEAMGVDSVMVHLGADQRHANPALSPFAGLQETVARVHVPVGVGTFSVEDGKTAFRLGASIAVIGVPIIRMANPEPELRRYVEEAKAEYGRRVSSVF